VTYEDEIRGKRAAREARLAAEDGWLTVVDRHELEAGPNVLPFGTVDLTGGVARFGDRVLATDVDAIVHEGLRYEYVERGGIHAIRVRDPQSPARTRFRGLDYFPIDPRWRIVARVDPAGAGEIELPHSRGGVAWFSSPGTLTFEIDGVPCRLTPGATGTGLFVPFRDETGGRETFGGGRFVDGGPGAGGEVVLDFNLAKNLPCSFTHHVSCPLPPPQNRLAVRVTAGEKKFEG
jgi:hypothetical protein